MHKTDQERSMVRLTMDKRSVHEIKIRHLIGKWYFLMLQKSVEDVCTGRYVNENKGVDI